jgi:hypothetical protein
MESMRVYTTPRGLGNFQPAFWIPGAIRSDSERLAWIAAPGEAKATLGDGTLNLFHQAGREAEVEEVPTGP